MEGYVERRRSLREAMVSERETAGRLKVRGGLRDLIVREMVSVRNEDEESGGGLQREGGRRERSKRGGQGRRRNRERPMGCTPFRERVSRR